MKGQSIFWDFVIGKFGDWVIENLLTEIFLSFSSSGKARLRAPHSSRENRDCWRRRSSPVSNSAPVTKLLNHSITKSSPGFPQLLTDCSLPAGGLRYILQTCPATETHGQAF
jgi:hypothetical protein